MNKHRWEVEVNGSFEPLDEDADNLGKTRRNNYTQWLGFCEECGGTGRSESGCQPCEVCDNGRI
jgi:hypothetical protein